MGDSGRFLTAEWRNLAMINFEVDPAILRPYVPSVTELDDWNGRTYVSLVGFLFLKTRVLGMPIPFHRNFEEVNLRFYVRRKADDGWRRGVVFIKEIVPRWAIASVARVLYNEKYSAMPMSHRIVGGLNVEYRWRFEKRWNSLRVKGVGAWHQASAGSEEEFITEHYWGYSAQSDGGCVEYRVEHPRWNVVQAGEMGIDCDAHILYGPKFDSILRSAPTSAFLADGSPIIVRKGLRL
jgi:uncharacterized protein